MLLEFLGNRVSIFTSNAAINASISPETTGLEAVEWLVYSTLVSWMRIKQNESVRAILQIHRKADFV